MPEAAQQFTMAEVRESKSKSRTLVVIYDKVYDVSSFFNEHPGGEEVLIDQAGKDATEDFQDVGHSSDAIQLMRKYEVGELVAAERKNRPTKAGWKAGASSPTPEKDKYVGTPGLPFGLLAAASLAVILAVFYLFVL